MKENELSYFLQKNISVLQTLNDKLNMLVGLISKIDRSIGVNDNLPPEELRGREGLALTAAEDGQFVQVLVGGQTIMGVAKERILSHEKVVIAGGDVASPDIYPVPTIIRGLDGISQTYNITSVNPAGQFETIITAKSDLTVSDFKKMTVGLDKGTLTCNGTWNLVITGFEDSTLTTINLPDNIRNKTTGELYSTVGAVINGNTLTLSSTANTDLHPPKMDDILSLSLTFAASDILKQFPPTIAGMTLGAGATYTTTYNANKKLMYLSVDLPQGVNCTIKNDNVTWLEDTDSIGALEFVSGILFGIFEITVTNTTVIAQNFSVKAIFEAYE